MTIDLYLTPDGTPTFRPSETAQRLTATLSHGLIDDTRDAKINFDNDTVTLYTTLGSGSIMVWTANGVWKSAKNGDWGFRLASCER